MYELLSSVCVIARSVYYNFFLITVPCNNEFKGTSRFGRTACMLANILDGAHLGQMYDGVNSKILDEKRFKTIHRNNDNYFEGFSHYISQHLFALFVPRLTFVQLANHLYWNFSMSHNYLLGPNTGGLLSFFKTDLAVNMVLDTMSQMSIIYAGNMLSDAQKDNAYDLLDRDQSTFKDLRALTRKILCTHVDGGVGTSMTQLSVAITPSFWLFTDFAKAMIESAKLVGVALLPYMSSKIPSLHSDPVVYGSYTYGVPTAINKLRGQRDGDKLQILLHSSYLERLEDEGIQLQSIFASLCGNYGISTSASAANMFSLHHVLPFISLGPGFVLSISEFQLLLVALYKVVNEDDILTPIEASHYLGMNMFNFVFYLKCLYKKFSPIIIAKPLAGFVPYKSKDVIEILENFKQIYLHLDEYNSLSGYDVTKSALFQDYVLGQNTKLSANQIYRQEHVLNELYSINNKIIFAHIRHEALEHFTGIGMAGLDRLLEGVSSLQINEESLAGYKMPTEVFGKKYYSRFTNGEYSLTEYNNIRIANLETKFGTLQLSYRYEYRAIAIYEEPNNFLNYLKYKAIDIVNIYQLLAKIEYELCKFIVYEYGESKSSDGLIHTIRNFPIHLNLGLIEQFVPPVLLPWREDDRFASYMLSKATINAFKNIPREITMSSVAGLLSNTHAPVHFGNIVPLTIGIIGMCRPIGFDTFSYNEGSMYVLAYKLASSFLPESMKVSLNYNKTLLSLVPDEVFVEYSVRSIDFSWNVKEFMLGSQFVFVDYLKDRLRYPSLLTTESLILFSEMTVPSGFMKTTFFELAINYVFSVSQGAPFFLTMAPTFTDVYPTGIVSSELDPVVYPYINNPILLACLKCSIDPAYALDSLNYYKENSELYKAYAWPMRILGIPFSISHDDDAIGGSSPGIGGQAIQHGVVRVANRTTDLYHACQNVFHIQEHIYMKYNSFARIFRCEVKIHLEDRKVVHPKKFICFQLDELMMDMVIDSYMMMYDVLISRYSSNTFEVAYGGKTSAFLKPVTPISTLMQGIGLLYSQRTILDFIKTGIHLSGVHAALLCMRVANSRYTEKPVVKFNKKHSMEPGFFIIYKLDRPVYGETGQVYTNDNYTVEYAYGYKGGASSIDVTGMLALVKSCMLSHIVGHICSEGYKGIINPSVAYICAASIWSLVMNDMPNFIMDVLSVRYRSVNKSTLTFRNYKNRAGILSEYVSPISIRLFLAMFMNNPINYGQLSHESLSMKYYSHNSALLVVPAKEHFKYQARSVMNVFLFPFYATAKVFSIAVGGLGFKFHLLRKAQSNFLKAAQYVRILKTVAKNKNELIEKQTEAEDQVKEAKEVEKNASKKKNIRKKRSKKARAKKTQASKA